MWFENCSMALDNAFQNLQLKKAEGFFLLVSSQFFFGIPSFCVSVRLVLGNTEKLLIYAEVGSILQPCCDSQRTLNLKGWKDAWCMIENIYVQAVDSGNVWKEYKNSQRKRTALSMLLNLLERSGLIRHMSTNKVV